MNENKELEQILNNISSEEAMHASRVANYDNRQAAKANREWNEMRGNHLATIQDIITRKQNEARIDELNRRRSFGIPPYANRDFKDGYLVAMEHVAAAEEARLKELQGEKTQ